MVKITIQSVMDLRHKNFALEKLLMQQIGNYYSANKRTYVCIENKEQLQYPIEMTYQFFIL